MENLNHIIANNLIKIRRENSYSLDQVAKLTGVSKSMLGQIERCETNPSITTIWKIANGLKLSFTSLIQEERSSVYIVSKDDIEPILEKDSKYRLYPLFHFDDKRRFEVYSVELDPGARLEAEPHGKGAEEYLTVIKGELILGIGDESYKLSEGNSISFNADKTHVYENTGSELTSLYMIVYYPS